jgi:hypothetical protein
MGTHMKTTIEIADALLEDARQVAEREHTTLRSLVEQGLRRVLRDRRGPGRFRLKRVTFKGRGLRPDVADADWDRIRALTYGDRGGS